MIVYLKECDYDNPKIYFIWKWDTSTNSCICIKSSECKYVGRVQEDYESLEDYIESSNAWGWEVTPLTEKEAFIEML